VTVHPASPLHVTVERCPTVIVHDDEPAQLMLAPVPADNAHCAAPSQANRRSIPAVPLHEAPSPQLMFDALPTSSVQVLEPLHVCTQLPEQATVHEPEAHVQIDSFEQLQVEPVQICGTGTQAARHSERDSQRMGLLSSAGAISATPGAPSNAGPGGAL
jgi:hypothetical protein